MDDSSDDRILLRRALIKSGVLNPIQEAKSGVQAIAYLNGEAEFADRTKYPLPGIILLDLNMPGIDGFGVLQWIRANPQIEGILIIVLSRLDDIKEINRAYTLGANSFLAKPNNEADLEGLTRSFHDYWLLRNRSPQS